MLRLDCSDHSIALASRKVREGCTIVYPTDTVYGLGCDPYNYSAVEAVIKIKGREEGKPMPLLCSSITHANRIGKFDESSRKLAEKFWPGALTIIVELIDDRISRLIADKSVGLRVPDHQCTLKLIGLCGGVIVGTSANRTGSLPARTANEAGRGIQGYDILIDGGETSGIASTVLKVSDENIVIIREGRIKRQDIEEVLPHHV